MEYVDRVNKMAGGRLQIEYLVAGAVVKPFSVMDAVHEGVLDGGHHVTVYWYGKHKAASLFGTGPYFGWNAAQGLAWIHKGGGKALYDELINTSSASTSSASSPCRCRPSRSAGSRRSPTGRRTAGPEVPHGRSGGRPVPEDGHVGGPAAGRRDRRDGPRLLDAASSTTVSDKARSRTCRRTTCGATTVGRVFEIIFNKDKFDAFRPSFRRSSSMPSSPSP